MQSVKARRVAVGELAAALSAAGDGDELRLAPGIHVGPFRISRAVTLRAEGEPGSTALRGDRLRPVLSVEIWGVRTPARLEGLRVLHGGGLEGAGIHLRSGELRLDRCRIERNRSLHFGGGVFCGDGGVLRATDTLFRRNFSLGGGGVYGGQGADIELSGCRFVRNKARCGAAMGFEGGRAAVTRCLVVDNTATLNGSAVAIRVGGEVRFDRVLLADNGPRPAIEQEDQEPRVEFGAVLGWNNRNGAFGGALRQLETDRVYLRQDPGLERARGKWNRPVGRPAVVPPGSLAADFLGWSGYEP